MNDFLHERQAVVDAAHLLVEKKLIDRTWGNVSCRVDERRFVITPSGMGYDRMTTQDVVLVDACALTHEAGKTPSGETGIHASVYRIRPDIQFVIHTHQQAASIISVAGYAALQPRQTELSILGGPVPRAIYALPCTKKLCQNVADTLQSTGCNVLFMTSHGILSLGADSGEAFRRAETLERLCRRAIKSEAPGPAREGCVQPIIDSIRMFHPEYSSILPVANDAVRRISESGKTLSPMLDDFSQMVGVSVKNVTLEATPFALRSAVDGRNALLIRGCGALALGENPSDGEAVRSLLVKECETQLNARQYGQGKPLPMLDRQIMRGIYVNKYKRLK